MTPDEELDFKHQVDRLETDVTRINSESARAMKDIKALRAAASDLQEVAQLLVKAAALVPRWVEKEHNTMQGRKAREEWERLMGNLESRLSQ